MKYDRAPPLQLQIPKGGRATLHGPGTLSMKVEYLLGAPPLVETLTHTKLHMQVLGSLHGGGLVCLLQLLLLAVSYTRCRGVDGVFQPWGKGLMLSNLTILNGSMKVTFYSSIHLVDLHNLGTISFSTTRNALKCNGS